MHLHRIVDGIAAILIVAFVLVEYVLHVNLIPDLYMSLGDVVLHILIFGSLMWHVIWERLRTSTFKCDCNYEPGKRGHIGHQGTCALWRKQPSLKDCGG